MRFKAAISGMACALAMLAATSCTTPPAPPLSPRAPRTSAPPHVVYRHAESIGDSRATDADRALLEIVRRDAGVKVPLDIQVIVIHRASGGGAGEVAWLPDSRSYCLAVVREARAMTTCGAVPKSWAPGEILLRGKGELLPDPDRILHFAIVAGEHGPYAFAGADLGPVREGTGGFPSGPSLSLLTYEAPKTPASDARICSEDNAICFSAFDAPPLAR